MREGWVLMKHPANGIVTEATQEAFDEVWQEKGFVLAEDDDVSEDGSMVSLAADAGATPDSTKKGRQ